MNLESPEPEMQIAQHNLTRQTRRGQQCAHSGWPCCCCHHLRMLDNSSREAYCRIKDPRRYPLSSVAVRQLPCGPDEVSYGYKPTRWSEWPGWETAARWSRATQQGSVEEFRGPLVPVPAEEPIPAARRLLPWKPHRLARVTFSGPGRRLLIRWGNRRTSENAVLRQRSRSNRRLHPTAKRLPRAISENPRDMRPSCDRRMQRPNDLAETWNQWATEVRSSPLQHGYRRPTASRLS